MALARKIANGWFKRAFYLGQAPYRRSLALSAWLSYDVGLVWLRGVLPLQQTDGLRGLNLGVGHVTAGQAGDVEAIEVSANLAVALAPVAGLEDDVVLVKDILGGCFLAHRIYSPKVMDFSKLVTPYTIGLKITLTECERIVNAIIPDSSIPIWFPIIEILGVCQPCL